MTQKQKSNLPVAVFVLCVIGVVFFGYAFISYVSGAYWRYIIDSGASFISFVSSGIRFSCRLSYVISFYGLFRMKMWGFVLCVVAWLAQLIPNAVHYGEVPVSSLVQLCVYCIIPFIFFKQLSTKGMWKALGYALLIVFGVHALLYAGIKLSMDDNHTAESAYKQAQSIENRFLATLDLFQVIMEERGVDEAVKQAERVSSPFIRSSVFLQIAEHVRGEDPTKYSHLVKLAYTAIMKEHNLALRASTLISLRKAFNVHGSTRQGKICLDEACSSLLQLRGAQTNIELSAILRTARTLAKSGRINDALAVANKLEYDQSREALTKEIESIRKTVREPVE